MDIQRVPGIVCQGHALPLPQAPWYFDEKQLSEEARGRLQRWKARYAAKDAGRPVLSLAELGSLIKHTEHALAAAARPGDVATLSVQLEDMKHEFDWRTFLDVNETIWPADQV
jgi:hypothetical protein